MPSLSPGKGLLAASQEAAEAEAGWAVRSPLSVTHPQSTTPPNHRRPTLAVRTAVCPGHRPRSPRPTRPRSARGPSSQTEQPLFPERRSSFRPWRLGEVTSPCWGIIVAFSPLEGGSQRRRLGFFFFSFLGMLMLLLSINGLLTHPALLMRLVLFFVFFNIYLFGCLGS